MESINRPELVKEHNLNLVRQQLFALRQATRQQLSAATGISNVTMGTLLSQLLENNEALETEKVQSAGGRPASMYSYNARREYALLLSVGFEKTEYRFRAVLIDLYGEVVWEEGRPAVCLDYDETLAYMKRLLQIRTPVSAIGIGLPGIGFGEYLHKGKGAEYLSLEALESLREETKLPVQVENDVNLAAMGYAMRNGIGPKKTLAYLYLMRGTYGGSAIYLNGRLHLGKGRFAGEMLPPPYNSGWFRMEPENTAVLEEALFTTLLPYLTILAPHHLAVASDYIKEEQLRAVEARLSALVGPQHCPEFSPAGEFGMDYQKGLERLALEQMPFPVGKR